MTREFRDQISKEELQSLRQSVVDWLEKSKGNSIETKKASQQPQKKSVEHIPQPSPNESVLPKSPHYDLKEKGQHHQTRGGVQKRRGIGRLIFFVALILISTILVYWVYLYFFTPTSRLSLGITRIVPYPVALVNFQPVSYYEWAYQVQTLNHFYEREAAQNELFEYPERDVTLRHIFQRVIEQQVIASFAKEYNITVTEQELATQLNQLTTEVGGEENLKNQITELYGWSLEDFSQNVLKPLKLKDKLKVALTADDRINEQARKEAEQIRQKILDGEMTFTAAAAQFSQDVTALQGGDLGYFGRGEMVANFETTAFNLRVGEISPVVRTQFGYHIIEVTERTLNDEGEVRQIRARHILIRSQDAEGIIDEAIMNAKIIKLINLPLEVK